MLSVLLSPKSHARLLIALLLFVNVSAWIWAFFSFNHSSSLMGACLLAWCYGLRHAVDADHIAAIDNVTRKMMQQGKKPCSVGAWFSLGHSTIVVLATIAIAATACDQQMDWFHETGGMVGTLVSAVFLSIMALVNLVILKSVWNNFNRLKKGEKITNNSNTLQQSGIIFWIFKKTSRFVSKSWHMYLIGFLFGIGFDTATEIGVLGISAVSASSGMSVWSILIFPALFTCGMALIDTLDNIIMIEAYGWAFNKPQRKLYYNMTITGTSVIVAIFIGGTEIMGLLINKLDLHGEVWEFIGLMNDDLGNAGIFIVGLFILCWLTSILNYKWKGYDTLTIDDNHSSAQ